jgi:hypothetical protein
VSSPSPQRPRGSSRGKRAAERPPSRLTLPKVSLPKVALPTLSRRSAVASEAPEPVTPGPDVTPPAVGERVVTESYGPSHNLILGWLGCGLLGTVLLVVAGLGFGPDWLPRVGAVVVVTVFAWLLAARTAGRALIAATIAFALGVLAVVVGGPILPTGAAVMTAAIGGVYAVLATVPAVTYWKAVREVGVATVLSGIAALAAAGFGPTVSATRFDIVSLVVGLVLCVALVYRLGAGFHGLGRRGLIAVTVGTVVLLATLTYAEMLQRYGSGVIVSVLDLVEATRAQIGAFPRPLVVLLGIPALVWGVHLRARRREGWWVCAFGVAATVPFAAGLVAPDYNFIQAALRAIYSLALGLPLAYLVIRADLALAGSRGERARRAEEASAHRPEPTRFGEL